ncbi:MAG: hypothetical protein ACRCZY_02360 [Phocaeicola sp.]
MGKLNFAGHFWLEDCIYLCGMHINLQLRFNPTLGKEAQDINTTPRLKNESFKEIEICRTQHPPN